MWGEDRGVRKEGRKEPDCRTLEAEQMFANAGALKRKGETAALRDTCAERRTIAT